MWSSKQLALSLTTFTDCVRGAQMLAASSSSPSARLPSGVCGNVPRGCCRAQGPGEGRLRRTMGSTSDVSGDGVDLSGSKDELGAGKSDTSRSYEKQASSILFTTTVSGWEDCECGVQSSITQCPLKLAVLAIHGGGAAVVPLLRP